MTHHHHEHTGVWVTCGTCWGQRRVWAADPHGALRPEPCPICLGLGERLHGGDQMPAEAPR